MTITPDYPSIPDSFRAICQLSPQDPRLIFLTKETNLYLEVLYHQGQRHQLSPYDLKTLLARMCDLMTVAPHAPPEPAPQPEPVARSDGFKLDLDDIERQTKPPKVLIPKG